MFTKIIGIDNDYNNLKELEVFEEEKNKKILFTNKKNIINNINNIEENTYVILINEIKKERF